MALSAVTVAVGDATVRVLLRVYFAVTFGLVSLVGTRVCDDRIRLLLAQGKSVPLPLTTSWLSGVSAAVTWFQQKRPPGGFMAPLMILVPLATLSSDLLVSGLVGTTLVPGRCDFGTGLVIPRERPPINVSAYPSFPQRGAEIADQAQLTSLENGGLSGIFWKTNKSPRFRAEARDVAGRWRCSVTNHSTVDDPRFDPAQNRTEAALEVLDSLLANGVVYETGYSSARWCPYRNLTPQGGFLHVSTSQTALHDLWDLKIAVDDGISRRDCGILGPFRYHVYLCSMDAAPVEWLMRNMDTRVFGGWPDVLYSKLQSGDYGDAGRALESALAVVIMLAYDSQADQTARPWGDDSVGCLADVTTIPWPVAFLAVLAALAVIVLGVLWVSIFVAARRLLSAQRPPMTTHSPPSGLLPWMQYAVSGGRFWQETPARDLGNWSLSWAASDHPTLAIRFTGHAASESPMCESRKASSQHSVSW